MKTSGRDSNINFSLRYKQTASASVASWVRTLTVAERAATRPVPSPRIPPQDLHGDRRPAADGGRGLGSAPGGADRAGRSAAAAGAAGLNCCRGRPLYHPWLKSAGQQSRRGRRLGCRLSSAGYAIRPTQAAGTASVRWRRIGGPLAAGRECVARDCQGTGKPRDRQAAGTASALPGTSCGPSCGCSSARPFDGLRAPAGDRDGGPFGARSPFGVRRRSSARPVLCDTTGRHSSWPEAERSAERGAATLGHGCARGRRCPTRNSEYQDPLSTQFCPAAVGRPGWRPF